MKNTEKIFTGVFLYSLTLAVFFQTVILPLFPEIYAGQGLLKGDALVFHESALDLAKKIIEKGWGEYSIFPGNNSFNVSFLAILYKFWPSPLVLLTFNAAAHALSACMFYLIAKKSGLADPVK